jgi:hypothetical protein
MTALAPINAPERGRCGFHRMTIVVITKTPALLLTMS